MRWWHFFINSFQHRKDNTWKSGSSKVACKQVDNCPKAEVIASICPFIKNSIA